MNIQTIITYPMAFDRSDCHVTPADITKAVELFTATMGRPPAALYLHPERIKHLAGHLPDIPVIEHAGVLVWEIWLTAENSSPTIIPPAATPEAHEQAPDAKITTPVTVTPQSHVQHPVTDNPAQLTFLKPTINQLIQEAMSTGKTTRERSTRTIARLLKSRGIQVSHMTINRRIKSFNEKH